MRPDRTIGAVTALVVGAVTALAFAQSFHALRGFAEAQQVVPVGWGWMFAATIDGFALAALLTSLSLSLQGDHGAAPWAVRALAVTAVAISLVFNLQHVPTGMARWGAAVPPVAVLAGLEVRKSTSQTVLAYLLTTPPRRQRPHPGRNHLQRPAVLKQKQHPPCCLVCRKSVPPRRKLAVRPGSSTTSRPPPASA